MTPIEYLRSKYQAMGVSLSDEYIKTLLIGKCAMLNEMTAGDKDAVHRMFVESLPEFLLMPTSVSELGVSISRASSEAIEKYYQMECRRLGIPNRLAPQPKVRFL